MENSKDCFLRHLSCSSLFLGAEPWFLGVEPWFLGAEPWFLGAEPWFLGAEPWFLGAEPWFLGAEPWFKKIKLPFSLNIKLRKSVYRLQTGIENSHVEGRLMPVQMQYKQQCLYSCQFEI